MKDDTKKTLRLLCIILFIVVIILIGLLLFPIFYLTSYSLEFYDNMNVKALQERNRVIQNHYINEVYPKGKMQIESELVKIAEIKDDSLKLDEIFLWEMQDWHSPNWEIDENDFYIHDNIRTYYRYKHNESRIYVTNIFENSIFRQETPNGIYYGDDPIWIAYNRVGACRELSNLFAYMAQQSKIESRIIRTISDHQWVEVKINGEWYYYDPWYAVQNGYFNRSDGNLSLKYKWFNKPKVFREYCNPFAVINYYTKYPYFASIDYII